MYTLVGLSAYELRLQVVFGVECRKTVLAQLLAQPEAQARAAYPRHQGERVVSMG